MLTNDEQRRLIDIESRLHADDPALARRMNGELGGRPRPRRLPGALATSMTLAVIVVLTYGVAGALVVAFAGLLAANYLAHRYVHTRLDGHHPLDSNLNGHYPFRAGPRGRYPRHGDHMD
jgi:hypothetical protein